MAWFVYIISHVSFLLQVSTYIRSIRTRIVSTRAREIVGRRWVLSLRDALPLITVAGEYARHPCYYDLE